MQVCVFVQNCIRAHDCNQARVCACVRECVSVWVCRYVCTGFVSAQKYVLAYAHAFLWMVSFLCCAANAERHLYACVHPRRCHCSAHLIVHETVSTHVLSGDEQLTTCMSGRHACKGASHTCVEWRENIHIPA